MSRPALSLVQAVRQNMLFSTKSKTKKKGRTVTKNAIFTSSLIGGKIGVIESTN